MNYSRRIESGDARKQLRTQRAPLFVEVLDLAANWEVTRPRKLIISDDRRLTLLQ
jgi:hypothetical protein